MATPVSELYERISLLVKPTGMMHIVEKQPTKSLHLQADGQDLSYQASLHQAEVCLSLPVSQPHLFWLAPSRSVPWLVSLSSTFSLSTQPSSARLSSSQSPASLMCPP